MCTLRAFSAFDLLAFNNVNLDPLTETYNMSFYLQYLAKWPEYCFTADAPGARAMGYILGKAESFARENDSWHGHVTAVTEKRAEPALCFHQRVRAADSERRLPL